MNDSNPFDEFINGLDLPEPDGDEPPPATPDDVDAAGDPLTQRVRTMVRAIIMRVSEQPTEEREKQLNGLQLFVCNELLNCTVPRPGVLDDMSKEEVAMNVGYTMITLAWMIYDEVVSTLMPPYDEPGGKADF